MNQAASNRPPLPARPATFGEIADRALERGFAVMPVRGKVPALKNWNSRSLGRRAIENLLQKNPVIAGSNVGFRTGKMIAVDIDHTDHDMAHRIERAAMAMLGNTPFVRIGNWPKRMLFYRTKDAQSSCKIGKVEILSARRSAVVAGIHPDTNKPYYWPEEFLPDAEFSDVPEITADYLRLFVQWLEFLHKQQAAYAADQTERARKEKAAAIGQALQQVLHEASIHPHGMVDEGRRNDELFRYAIGAARNASGPADLLKKVSAHARRCLAVSHFEFRSRSRYGHWRPAR